MAVRIAVGYGFYMNVIQGLSVPEKTQLAGGIPDLAFKPDGGQAQLARSLGENGIAPFDNAVTGAVPLSGEFTLFTQAFNDGVWMFGVRQLAANPIAGEIQLYRQHQLFLHVHV